MGLILYWIFHAQKLKLTKSDYWYWGWLGILFVSSLLNHRSLIGEGYRHQGVIFFLLIWLIGKMYSALAVKMKRLFQRMMAGVICFEALIVLMGHGTMGENNAVAGLMASAPVFLSSWVGLGLVMVAIITSVSKSGLVVFGLILLGMRTSMKNKLW